MNVNKKHEMILELNSPKWQKEMPNSGTPRTGSVRVVCDAPTRAIRPVRDHE